ncbi:MAG TPA: hypothetical protein VF547_11045 [Allosphingosinicella sp.]|jgi:hypothetical protein
MSPAAAGALTAVLVTVVIAAGTEPRGIPPAVIAAAISAAIALIVLSVGWKTAWLQRAESIFRSVPSLTVEVEPSFLETPGEEDVILQTKVIVRNISRTSCTIPAVYIRYHCLGVPPSQKHVGRVNADLLPKWGSMGQVVNAAWVHRAVVQLGPDEIEEFVRWDTLDKVSVARAPTSIAVVDVFATTIKEIGGGIVPRSRPGRLRQRWLQFMSQDDCVRNTEVIFARYDPEIHGRHPELDIYQRVIVRPGSEGTAVDLENTRIFKPILRHMLRWTRYQNLNVLGARGPQGAGKG